MSAQRRGVRSRRSGPVVAVTAAAGPLGGPVARALASLVGSPDGPSQVLALDADRSDPDGAGPDRAGLDGASPDGLTWQLGDVADPTVAERLAGADVVVHVAAPVDLAADLAVTPLARRARAVRSVQAVTTAAAAVGARRLVVVSSAVVLGARPDNAVPLPDDAPLRAVPDDGLVGDLLEVERILARVPRVHPGLRLTVLRPAALVGPGVDTAVTRHFEAPRLLAVPGAGMVWQFCHVDDLAAAVVEVVRQDLDGALTVGALPLLSGEQVEQLTGMRAMVLPESFAFGTAERLHRLGMLPMPAADLAYVVHPWAVGADRLRAAGWQPGHDNQACLEELLVEVRGRRTVAGRRLERRDAALGAAGAAVALVGTAAVVRQARARRRRRGRPTL